MKRRKEFGSLIRKICTRVGGGRRSRRSWRTVVQFCRFPPDDYTTYVIIPPSRCLIMALADSHRHTGGKRRSVHPDAVREIDGPFYPPTTTRNAAPHARRSSSTEAGVVQGLGTAAGWSCWVVARRNRRRLLSLLFRVLLNVVLSHLDCCDETGEKSRSSERRGETTTTKV